MAVNRAQDPRLETSGKWMMMPGFGPMRGLTQVSFSINQVIPSFMLLG